MSEKLNSELYRKGLAQSLKEIRGSKEDGPEKAKIFLDIAKQTNLYKVAETEHREETRASGESSRSTHDEAQEVVSDSIESKESREAEMIDELLRLISSDTNFQFGLSANGRLRPGEGSSIGQTGYLLEQGSQSLKPRGNNASFETDPIIYDRQGDTVTPYQPFLKTDFEGKFVTYQGWINWKNTSPNPFSSDSRGANNFSGSLFIRNGEEAVKAASKELFKVICAPESRETKQIMWKFLIRAFEKYAPEYWKFIEKQWQEQPGNKDKDIRNYFD